MAYYEKRCQIACVRAGAGAWRGTAVLDLPNQQRLNKLVVRHRGDAKKPGPDFRVSLFASERAAAPAPYADDDLNRVMPAVTGAGGYAQFFDVQGYAFQDMDVRFDEVWGKLRVVVELRDDDPGGWRPADAEAPVFLVAVGGDVPGAVGHGSTVYLAE